MDLRGPCEYKKSLAAFRNLKNPDIVDASIELSGEIMPLQENWFSVERGIDTLFVWHHYRHHDTAGGITESRWHNTRMPLDTFKKIRRVFRHNVGSFIIRIQFTQKIADELRTID
jgi:hypothetical protein